MSSFSGGLPFYSFVGDVPRESASHKWNSPCVISYAFCLLPTCIIDNPSEENLCYERSYHMGTLSGPVNFKPFGKGFFGTISVEQQKNFCKSFKMDPTLSLSIPKGNVQLWNRNWLIMESPVFALELFSCLLSGYLVNPGLSLSLPCIFHSQICMFLMSAAALQPIKHKQCPLGIDDWYRLTPDCCFTTLSQSETPICLNHATETRDRLWPDGQTLNFVIVVLFTVYVTLFSLSLQEVVRRRRTTMFRRLKKGIT